MSKSVKLRVPFAFDDEKRLYDPETAEKGNVIFALLVKMRLFSEKAKSKRRILHTK